MSTWAVLTTDGVILAGQLMGIGEHKSSLKNAFYFGRYCTHEDLASVATEFRTANNTDDIIAQLNYSPMLLDFVVVYNAATMAPVSAEAHATYVEHLAKHLPEGRAK